MDDLQILGTCSDPQIAKISEKRGRKISYKKAKNLIKNFDFDLYNFLSLDLRNPWKDETNIKRTKEGEILHLVHSAIDYLFILKK